MLLLIIMQMAASLFAIDYSLPFSWRFTPTAAPEGPVRPIAEFEPSSHVIVRYPLGIPSALVAQLSNTAEVICIVAGTYYQNAATNAFQSAGVNMDNLSFLTVSTDSYWTRDYSPWFIYDGNGDYAVVDFRYNRPRPGDELVPQAYADHFDLPYYGMNLYQTGGNYMTDGINSAIQSHIAYTENSNNQANVNALMQSFLGIENYYVVQDPNNTYIDHVDCWGKYLAPDKVLIRSVPASHARYAALEATADYFANQLCAWGYPYRVYRVNTPQDQPYSNSLILNNKVFVPITNSSADNPALEVYRNAMPGYEVIGVPGASSTPWLSTDALHCRTHEVPDKDMLHIAHMPYFGVQNQRYSYEINAQIIAHSGAELYSDSLFVALKINSGTWDSVPLIRQDGINFRAELTELCPGDSIRYYIYAADQSGRNRSHPQFAEKEPHLFSIYGDNTPPIVQHNPPTYQGELNLSLVAQISDDTGVESATLHYFADEMEAMSIPMDRIDNDVWLASLNMAFADGMQNLYYQITAQDLYGNVGYWPEEGSWQEVPLTQTGVASSETSPQALLSNIWPNPIRRGNNLQIKVISEETSSAQLRVFNLRGQLVQKMRMPKTGENFTWDLKDRKGSVVSAGIYFININTSQYSLNTKLLVLP